MSSSSSWSEVIRTEADAYHDRNALRGVGDSDWVITVIRDLAGRFALSRVLEIGAGSGDRLDLIRSLGLAQEVVGLEASSKAVAARNNSALDLRVGIAPQDLSQFAESSISCVIVNFIQYLLPRETLHSLREQVVRILEPNGHVVIIDFLYPRDVSKVYGHDQRLTLWKGDPSRLWTGDGTLTLVERRGYFLQEITADPLDPDQWHVLDVLRSP